MNDIAKRIAEIMKKKKISASDLSKKINVQKSSISHILSGRNKPSLDFVVKLSDSFNDINIDWLINGDKSTTPTLNSDLLEKNNNSKKRVTKIVLFYDDKSFDTYEGKLNTFFILVYYHFTFPVLSLKKTVIYIRMEPLSLLQKSTMK